jgi:hypothetical protein
VLARLQLIMVSSWFFMPPDVNIYPGVRFVPDGETDPGPDSYTEWLRHQVDSKLCLALYLVAALAWIGVQVGLIRSASVGAQR